MLPHRVTAVLDPTRRKLVSGEVFITFIAHIRHSVAASPVNVIYDRHAIRLFVEVRIHLNVEITLGLKIRYEVTRSLIDELLVYAGLLIDRYELTFRSFPDMSAFNANGNKRSRIDD